MKNRIFLGVMLLVGLVACSSSDVGERINSSTVVISVNPDSTEAATPFQPVLSTSEATVQPVFTPNVAGEIYLPLSAPPSLRKAIQSWNMTSTDRPAEADAEIEVAESKNSDQLFSAIYALVAPFPTVTDSISVTELQSAWSGIQPAQFSNTPLLMDENTLAAMKSLLGEPVEGAVRILESDQVLDTAWAERPSWAIIPFESLNPKWKVLELDGQSPLRKEFDPASYPLKVDFDCKGECSALPESNRDPSKLTTLIMTGTTALVRATAYRMEINGLTYPAQDIGPILKDADILHISNEIAFADDCPYPDPSGGNLQFCSDPKYMALLEDIGTDVVELTGNHVNDWGPQWLDKTIGMYQEKGWGFFGGGLNLSDSMKPYTTTHNGNQLAFIGCNLPGPVNAWATENSAGAAPCGDYVWMVNEISKLNQDGYLPIATIQFNEYYQLPPSETQARDFKSVAQAGAAIVSGSQSHFPQGFAFEGNTYIHYGPGNLFFDQMDYPVVGTRRAALDRYTIYDGQVIGVELITTMLEDWSRPRLMTSQERSQFLQELFEASGW